jgi:hypothetical protein
MRYRQRAMTLFLREVKTYELEAVRKTTGTGTE